MSLGAQEGRVEKPPKGANAGLGENYRHAGEAGLCPSGCEAPSR